MRALQRRAREMEAAREGRPVTDDDDVYSRAAEEAVMRGGMVG